MENWCQMPHVGQTNENANNFLVILFVGLKLSENYTIQQHFAKK